MDSELTPELIASIRRKSGEEKLLAAMDLYWTARELKAAGVRMQHPEWTEAQIREKVKEIFLHAVT